MFVFDLTKLYRDSVTPTFIKELEITRTLSKIWFLSQVTYDIRHMPFLDYHKCVFHCVVFRFADQVFHA